MGLKGRCAEGLFNVEHSTAECLWKCRWIYGRGICYTITLSHLRFFLHFTPGYTQELWAAMLENKIAVSKREQSWAIVSKALKGTCKGLKRYVKALKGTMAEIPWASVSKREQRWASMQCNIWIYVFFLHVRIFEVYVRTYTSFFYECVLGYPAHDQYMFFLGPKTLKSTRFNMTSGRSF